MYCPNCGSQQIDSANFCNNCGFSFKDCEYRLPRTPQRPIEKKSEYVNKSLKKSSFYPLLVFSIITFISGFVILFLNIENKDIVFSELSSDSEKMEAAVPFLIAIVLWLIAAVVFSFARRQVGKAENEYVDYLFNELRGTADPDDTQNNSSSKNTDAKEWVCPECGTVNLKRVKTCYNCGIERSDR